MQIKGSKEWRAPPFRRKEVRNVREDMCSNLGEKVQAPSVVFFVVVGGRQQDLPRVTFEKTVGTLQTTRSCPQIHMDLLKGSHVEVCTWCYAMVAEEHMMTKTILQAS